MKKNKLDSAWVALCLLPQLGSKRMNALLEEFESASGILAASEKDLMQVKGIGKLTASTIKAINLTQIETDIARWQKHNVKVIVRDDPYYPLPLSDEVADEPQILFALGEIDQTTWAQSMAIVGTRQPTETARKLASFFALRHAQLGYNILSGLALGIDTLAHQNALEAQGRTCAILGSGVLNIYPPQNKALAQRILDSGGTILCECPPEAEVSSVRLVARNRIISGLSRVLLMVESAVDGGAMHAIRFARQQNRTIFVFDLPASGNQAVIQQGADKIMSLE
jgi:DNA processing protein